MENKEFRVLERIGVDIRTELRVNNRHLSDLKKLEKDNHKSMIDFFIRKNKEMTTILIQLGRQIREIKGDLKTFYNDFIFYQQKSDDDGSQNMD
ncbi:MAG: hypothetical protein ACE5H1_12775, partial [Thermodesulfobacteriota bacterium]